MLVALVCVLVVSPSGAGAAPPVIAQGPDSTSVPRGYALLIGISDYEHLDDDGDLQFPEADAWELYRVLLSSKAGNFRADDIRTLIGPNATRANIESELEWIASAATKDDRVWIYFSGHGVVAGDAAYLAPYNWRPEHAADTAYALQGLGDLFRNDIKATWKVLLVDACHSGAIQRDDASRMNDSLVGVDGAFVMSASAEDQFAGESTQLGRGFFSWALTEGLKGAADGYRRGVLDGIVTAGELVDYVEQTIADYTGNAQTPQSSRQFDRSMLLAYDPARSLSQDVGAGGLVVTTNLDGVSVFIDGALQGVIDRGEVLPLPPRQANRTVMVLAAKMGWEPYGPIEETILPGQTVTVEARLTFPRRLDRDADARFDDGLRRFNDEDYERAIARFDEALQRDDRHSQAALYAARAYHAMGGSRNRRRARSYFERAIEIDLDYGEARSSFAGMLVDTGAVDEAIEQALVVTVLSPRDADAHAVLAQAYRINGTYREAIDRAQTAIGLAGQHANAHYWLADALHMSGRWDEAIPKYADYLRLSDFESGKAEIILCGILFPCSTRRPSQRDLWGRMQYLAYFGICDSTRNLSRFTEAIEACENALRIEDRDPYVYFALGWSYAKRAEGLDDLEAARRHLRHVLDLDPDLVDTETGESYADAARGTLTNLEACLANPARCAR